MRPLLVLFLLLALDLQHQGRSLQCYVCESENNFDCADEGNCTNREDYCVVAAMKIFPRFFIVSKQCHTYCPAMINSNAVTSRKFLLETPTPFLYVRCCKAPLCNGSGPNVSIDVFRQQIGTGHKKRCSYAVSTLLTLIAIAFAALGML